MGKSHLKKESCKFTHLVKTEEEAIRASDLFARWLSVYGGIDVYRGSSRTWFVEKGSDRPNWTSELVACVTERGQITIELIPKMIEGIVWSDDGIINIDTDNVDPDVLPIDLRTLSTKEAHKLDDDLTTFFYLKGSEQGANAKDGDGGHGVIPWRRDLEYGKAADDFESIVDGISGMNGRYLETLSDAFKAGLPKGLVVVEDDGSGDRWSVEKILRFSCPHCGNTITGRDEASRLCNECGEDLIVHATLPIVCETAGCPNFGSKINTICIFTGNEDEINGFYEQYGHGSEEPFDYCPKCKKLGVLKDPILTEVANADVYRTDHSERDSDDVVLA